MSVAWLDLVLVVLVPTLAWSVLAVRDLFTAVVLFIVFGGFLALVWVRLHAPDVALAEAAIGAGLTGALLLSALGRLQPPQQDGPVPRQLAPTEKQEQHPSWAKHVVAFLAIVVIGSVLGWAVLTLSPQTIGLTNTVEANLMHSGVSNPVTAVLLNFRGYDTLLEIGVLLLAVCGVWSLATPPAQSRGAVTSLTSPVFHVFVQFLAPILLLAGGYLLWAGAHAPGGAFQGGAVIGALVVILLLADRVVPPTASNRLLRTLLVMGFLCFLAVAVGVMIGGYHFLEYPRAWAGSLILLIEATLTVSIAVVLASLFGSNLRVRATATQRTPVQEPGN